jgi:acyl carrier protein
MLKEEGSDLLTGSAGLPAAAMGHQPADGVDAAAVIAQIGELISTRFSWVTVPEDGLAAARFRENLDLDSLHMVELQVAIEDQFAVMFDPDDEGLLDAFTTVGALASYVRRLRGD